eukprot:364282-Chlamydomonas_euryale.AAC.45
MDYPPVGARLLLIRLLFLVRSCAEVQTLARRTRPADAAIETRRLLGAPMLSTRHGARLLWPRRRGNLASAPTN